MTTRIPPRGARTADLPDRRPTRKSELPGNPRATPISVLGLIALLAVTACAGPALDWNDGDDDPPDLRSYKRSHYRALGEDFVGSVGRAEFLADVRATRVLYLGDHHQDAALHDRYLALLDRLNEAAVPVALGLEALGTADEIVLDAYLDGRIGLDRLRAEVRARWPGSWLERADLDADFYRQLLRRARRYRSPAFALEPIPRVELTERDRVIARRVGAFARSYPDYLIVVVVGHTHLLGQGDLVARVGLPAVAVGARLSERLRLRYAAGAPWPGEFVRTDAGVLFFNPR